MIFKSGYIIVQFLHLKTLGLNIDHSIAKADLSNMLIFFEKLNPLVNLSMKINFLDFNY